MQKQKKEICLQSGNRLRETRLRLGKTRTEFAEALGVSAAHYQKYESGAVGLTAYKLLLLYQKYKIDATWLVTGKNTVCEIDPERFLTNCSPQQKDALIEHVITALAAVLKN